jgi:serine O-acetyltransferase
MSISATEPDWSRERPRRWWDPSRRLLRALRRYQAARGPLAPLARKYWILQHRFWSVVTQADIPLGTVIGGGLKLPHPNGIVIHPQTRIGPNCLIFQQVTLGTRQGQPVAPRVGGHVDIGAGARILGNVTIGDHACIGANAVVLSDVPAGATVVGIPARILKEASETA